MTQEQKKILLKGGLWVLTGFLIMFLGITRPKALTTTTIYSNDARTQSNKYLYSLLTQGGTENIQTGNVGTNYTGRAIGISFFYNDNIMINKTYNMRINFYLDDLVPAFNTSMVHIQTCNSSSCNPVNLVGISKQNNSGYSTWVQISYTPQMAGNYVRVDLGDEQRNYLTGTTYFGINSVQIESVNQNEDIMNNANQNANNIINNNNSNTQEIIDNANSNTQAIIDSQYTCNIQTLKNYKGIDDYALTSSGSLTTASKFVVSDYIKIKSNSTYTLTKDSSWGSARSYCLYNNNQQLISCTAYSTNTTFTFTGADYVRYTWNNTTTRAVSLYGDICLKDSQQITDTINDDDIDDSDATSFFNDFTDNTHGLSGIISAPLNAINSMLSNQCTPLTASWKGQEFSFDCGTTFWSRLTGFKEFLNIALDGLLCYRILLKLWKMIEKLKNPNDDRVEVMDL